MFTTREPKEYSAEEIGKGESRDVYNEVPTEEERTHVPEAVTELAKVRV
jgi:hypothetical protein